MALTRRSLLMSATGVTALAAFAGCARPLPPAATGDWVDVHAHVFNAQDLPAEQFIRIVVRGQYRPDELPPTVSEGGDLVGLAISLMVQIVRMGAPAAEAEAAQLKARREGVPVAATPSPAEREAFERQLLEQILRKRFFAAPVGGDRPERRKAAEWETVVADIAPGLPPQSATPEAISRQVFLNDGFLARNLRWAMLFRRSRAGILQEMAALYSTGPTPVRFYLPALIDYSTWLEDRVPSALPAQVEVMDEVQRSRRDIVVHSLVAYDPLRQVYDEAGQRDPGWHQSPLELVAEAITRHGFVGVKLYPPMGFQPDGNERDKLVFPKPLLRANLGADLDNALRRLYAWCADPENDVPIMAHATNSQSAGNAYGDRANPKFWRRVLADYPQLRLNLAHFGGFDEAIAKDGSLTGALRDTWEWQAGQALIYPNVYVDLSYLSEIVGDTDETARRRRASTQYLLAQFIERFDPEVDRLMYGSDWSMIGRERAHDAYVHNMIGYLREVGLNDAQLARFGRRNALRFLGLQQGKPNYARIIAYRTLHSLPTEWLSTAAA